MGDIMAICMNARPLLATATAAAVKRYHRMSEIGGIHSYIMYVAVCFAVVIKKKWHVSEICTRTMDEPELLHCQTGHK